LGILESIINKHVGMHSERERERGGRERRRGERESARERERERDSFCEIFVSSLLPQIS